VSSHHLGFNLGEINHGRHRQCNTTHFRYYYMTVSAPQHQSSIIDHQAKSSVLIQCNSRILLLPTRSMMSNAIQ
jgi:hypothetical protein